MEAIGAYWVIFWPYALYIAVMLMFCVRETMNRLVLPAMKQPTFGFTANVLDALGAVLIVIGTIGLFHAQLSWSDVHDHLMSLAFLTFLTFGIVGAIVVIGIGMTTRVCLRVSLIFLRRHA